jgi:hypothetical protein
MPIGVAVSVCAALIGLPGIAMAQPPAPPPPPPPPNVNAYAPVNLSEYQVADTEWYAIKTPDGLTCVIQRNGGYGCSGPIPGAPEGASLVSGGPGVPSFANSPGDVFAGVNAKPLPAGSRLSYQTVSCGSDGSVTTCSDSRIQSGFVLSPAGSFIINGGRNPLVDRPEGTSPFIN